MTSMPVAGLVGFAFVSSITPGPNNLMLLASGANFGLRRTVPHMLGVSLGFGFLVLAVGLGFAGIITPFRGCTTPCAGAGRPICSIWRSRSPPRRGSAASPPRRAR